MSIRRVATTALALALIGWIGGLGALSPVVVLHAGAMATPAITFNRNPLIMLLLSQPVELEGVKSPGGLLTKMTAPCEVTAIC